MDTLDTGFSAPTDASGGEASTSPAGSLTGGSSDSGPVDGADFISSFLSGQGDQPTNSEGTEPAPTESESIPSAEDGGQEEDAPAQDAGLSVPATDEDLSALTDATAREHIRGLRQHVRGTLEPKAKGYDSFVGALQQYGLQEELLDPSLRLMSGILATQQRPVLRDGQPQYDPTTGQPMMEEVPTTFNFWNSLADLSQPHLTQLLNDAVQYFPEYVAQRIPREAAMQALGLDGETWQQFERFQQQGAFVPSARYDPDIADALPEDLRDLYRSADPDAQAEYNLMGAAAREIFLRQQQKIQAIEKQSQAAAEQQKQAQAQAVEQAAERRVQDFSNAKNTAFMSDLAKTWNPFGPGNEDKNKRMRETVFRDVQAQMFQNPKTVQLIQGLDDALRRNNQLAVTSIWTQLNVEVTRMRNDATAFYDEMLRARNGAQQAARDESAKLKAVTHTGGMPDNRQPDQIPEGDHGSALRSLAGSLGIRLT